MWVGDNNIITGWQGSCLPSTVILDCLVQVWSSYPDSAVHWMVLGVIPTFFGNTTARFSLQPDINYMHCRLFQQREEVKVMFEQFRSVGTDDLYQSQSLENHALLVMNALDETISNMDDPDYLIDMLLATGKSHHRFENFQPDIFWVGRPSRWLSLLIWWNQGHYVKAFKALVK